MEAICRKEESAEDSFGERLGNSVPRRTFWKVGLVEYSVNKLEGELEG